MSELSQPNGNADHRPAADIVSFEINGSGDSKLPHKLEKPSPSSPSKFTSRQLLRAALLMLWFWTSAFSLAILQLVGAPLYVVDKSLYYGWIEFTKRGIGLLVVSMTEWFSPAIVEVSGDASVLAQIQVSSDGNVRYSFADRMVLLANHQLYNDWAYLWWSAYANAPSRHGAVHIILKDVIKYVPVIGTGLRIAGFVFLSRKMDVDQPRLDRRLKQLSRERDGKLCPMWLLMFPEGTNMGVNGRAKSAKWAKKQGREDYKHQLIPRSTGTYFCLKALDKTVEWVYDCTMAYDGIPHGQYGQDVFPLYSVYLLGKSPNVHMHWRRFRVSSIPLSSVEEFDQWLQNLWKEKDELLEIHSKTGHFPSALDTRWPTRTRLGVRSYTELWQIFTAWSLLAIKPAIRNLSKMI